MKDFLGSVTDIGQYLEGVTFPADKREIVSTLRDNDAPDTIISVAEKIPDKVYDSVDNVVDEVKSRF